MRLSRDSVCTAATPVSGLSTYIAHSSGWSNPVWYLSATTRIRYSSWFRALRGHHPVLIDAGFADLEVPIPWWTGRTLRLRFPPR
jgi:hypothetical protein